MIYYFDRINKLNSKGYKRRSMPYDDFFGEMAISDESKEHRKAIAESIEDAVAFLFLIYPLYASVDYTDDVYLLYQFRERFASALRQNDVIIDDFLQAHIDRVTNEVYRVTVENFDIDENYFTSDDRAMFIAETQANNVVNYEEFDEAKLLGYDQKTWVTMQDNKVRESHRDVDGVTIPIDEFFDVGGDLMLFPTDDSNGANAENIVNCRCSIEYSKSNED